jgi:hypothetical protein
MRPADVVDEFRYVQIEPMTRAEVEASFQSGDPRLIERALIAIGLYDEDGEWVQDTCLRFLSHFDQGVVCAACTSLGHTARVNRRIDHSRVLPALRQLQANPAFAVHAQDAIEDIGLFAPRQGT